MVVVPPMPPVSPDPLEPRELPLELLVVAWVAAEVVVLMVDACEVEELWACLVLMSWNDLHGRATTQSAHLGLRE